jgi:hypothetical protein
VDRSIPSAWSIHPELIELEGKPGYKPRHRDKVHVQQGQIDQCRKMRLKTNRGLVRVDADSQVVCCDLKDIVIRPTGIVRVVGECLGIRQQQVLAVRCLYGDAVLQRTDVVP